ncbi:hypothetical protein LAZ67_1001166 [Cordylochernes scorpioides]|uniref:Ig-like domain-containing protein n=1 Tax=Cordylochernes scorpioides TaxID=51811 RepID=A0ABY6JXT2_9ARAC|nr:hypothetical protein LAZ67_1001166 [Cordylochernes scorpioides]
MPVEVRLNRGQRYQVTCTTSQGDRPLNFHWLRNGQPLVSNSRLTLRRLDDFSSALHIPSVTTEDVANFTCLASNLAGSDSFMTTLVVTVKPEWVRPPYDQDAVVGQRVTLECEASGSPPPIVTWIRDGRPVGSGNWHLGEAGRLSHPAVRPEDAGEYTCMADNGLGTALTKSITLQVQAGPAIEMNVTDPEVPSGGTLEIWCQARGDPPLRVTWRHRNFRLSDGSKNNRFFWL